MVWFSYSCGWDRGKHGIFIIYFIIYFLVLRWLSYDESLTYHESSIVMRRPLIRPALEIITKLWENTSLCINRMSCHAPDCSMSVNLYNAQTGFRRY